MARLSLTLLGGFHARSGPSGRPLLLARKKARALLAYLALRPGNAHSRDVLTALLWSDAGAGQARNSFRVTLFALRRALRSARVGCLSVKASAIALDAALADVDALSFRRLVAEGTPDALRSATDLYAGDLLEGLGVGEAAFEEWLTAEREQFRALAFHALQALLTHQLKAGAEELALATALRLLALDPLQEPVQRTVMQLQAGLDRPGAALRQYQACVAVLQRDLGVAPALETQQLYQQILRREAGTRPQASPADAAEPQPRGERSTTGPADQRLPRDIDLVGRQAELERLSAALAEAAGGRGRTVAVLGEAGVGKTRLVAELAALAHRRGSRLLLGRSYESERILPLAPWVDAIRSARVLPDSTLADALGPRWTTELARLFPEIGVPSSALAGEQSHHGRLFEAIARVLELLTEREPVVLLLEDLHWADELSARLLGFVARRAATWPLLLVVTTRDEELDGASVLRRVLDELDAASTTTRLALAPLPRTATTKLVQALSRSVDRGADGVALAERIWAVSHGNPFLIVETVNALNDGGEVSTVGAMPLPPRVRALVTSRLDRLSERARQLLGLAAVTGRAFEFSLLQEASGLGNRDAAAGLEELVRRRLLHAVGDGFDITHDWIREIVYGQLPAPLRRTLHAAVAGAVEAQDATHVEPASATLATHYREGEVWDKAFTYLHAAGRAAAARFGHREAVSRYETALEVSRHLPQTPDVLDRVLDLRIDLRYSLSGLGEFERLAAHLREAEPLARRLGDERRLGWVLVYMSYNFRMAGRLDEARSYSASARAIAARRGDVELELETDYEQGMTSLFGGDHRTAIGAHARVVEATDAARRITRWSVVTKLASRAYLARALAACGRFEEAFVHGRQALRIAEEVESPMNTIIACSELSNVHELRGEFGHAVPLLERGLACAREYEIGLLLPGVLGSLACVYGLSGRIADGLAMLEEFLKAGEPVGPRGSIVRVTVKAGELCLAAGDLDGAERLATQALTTARHRGMRSWEAEALVLLGEIAWRRPPADLEGAERHYGEALARGLELDMRPLAANCQLGLGQVHGRAGRRADARSALETARTMFREMGMRRGLKATEAELSRGARARNPERSAR